MHINLFYHSNLVEKHNRRENTSGRKIIYTCSFITNTFTQGMSKAANHANPFLNHTIFLALFLFNCHKRPLFGLMASNSSRTFATHADCYAVHTTTKWQSHQWDYLSQRPIQSCPTSPLSIGLSVLPSIREKKDLQNDVKSQMSLKLMMGKTMKWTLAFYPSTSTCTTTTGGSADSAAEAETPRNSCWWC